MKGKGILGVFIGLIAIIALFGFMLIGSYNGLVDAKESIDAQRGNIETQLQRRVDLIPNLVNTVKGYAAHETQIMTDIANARAKMAGATTAEEKLAANDELSSALSRLMVVVENYPTLKADSQYTALMDELAGTENRIQVARKDYNEVVAEYNKKIKKFPTVIIANMTGFDEEEYFEAKEGADTAPTVDFGV